MAAAVDVAVIGGDDDLPALGRGPAADRRHQVPAGPDRPVVELGAAVAEATTAAQLRIVMVAAAGRRIRKWCMVLLFAQG
ncbi:MAG: hypothetical protein WKF96_03990 [Solirubrobacteraceae bacterium]